MYKCVLMYSLANLGKNGDRRLPYSPREDSLPCERPLETLSLQSPADSIGPGSQHSAGLSAILCPIVMCLLQLGKSVGPSLLQLLLDLLKHLVVHAEQLDAQNQQKAEAARAESDLFLDMECVASLELATDKVPPPQPVVLCPQVPGTGCHF